MIIDSILRIAAALISLLELKERRKYIDRKMELQKQFYEEYNKPFEQRNNAVLDNIQFELCVLVETIAADLSAKNSGHIA